MESSESLGKKIKKRLPKSFQTNLHNKNNRQTSSKKSSITLIEDPELENDRLARVYQQSQLEENEISQSPKNSPVNESKVKPDGMPHGSQLFRETKKIVKDVDEMGNKMVNHFVILKELGRGVHGKVKLCKDINTGEEWV